MQNISNIRLRFAFMLTVAFMAASCAKDDLGVPTNSEGHPVRVTLNMGMGKSTDIVVTRADNSYSDLGNLYLFVYGSDGKYQQMLSTTATDPNNSITVGTRRENDNGVTYPITINTTSGTKNLLAVANTSAVADEGGFWSSMASIATDAAAGKLSFEQLKAAVISLRKDLYEKSTEMLPIQIVSSTQMLISGVNEGVVFDTNGNITKYGQLDGTNNVVVKMDRAMARITFNIAQTVKGAKGTFVPSSFRVYNIPTKSVLTNTNKSNTKSDTYINSAPMTIGNVSGGNYTFSFYMPENIPVANENASIASYQDRDKWSGDKGSRPENKTWTNAPQNSTFVVISGTYSQSGDTTDTTDKNSYTGNVSYTIHLGDFSDDAWSNFNVERNCSYTYKMSVKGVDKIVVEAEKEGNEQQPGAEGQIFTYDASTYSYELDAHYEQVFLEYNLSTIAKAITTKLGEYNQTQSDKAIDDAIADNLILVIQSEAMDYTHAATDDEPYTVQNKRGTFSPYRIYANAVRNAADPVAAKDKVLAGAGKDIHPTKGFDYKWVEFWPQTGTDIAAYPGVSKWSREDLDGFSNEGAYGGTATTESGYLKDVYDVIVAMGKVVKKIYKKETETVLTAEDGIIVTKSNNDYVARFTAFVNEYYYYCHPLTKAKVTSWSVITNKIPREMIIAMSSSISQDGNSSYSQIYSYITQASIQTFYNSRVSDINGFGIETYNETPHITFGKGGLNGLSKTDGRSNQITLIGGLPKDWNTFIASAYNGWTSSVSSDRTTHKLKEAAYKTNSGGSGAYYACLSRNRDLNGNGVIDNNEIRWYLPSLNEYIRIGVGSNAISNAAQLYMGDKMNMKRSTTPGSYADGYPIDYIWDGALYYTSSSDAERVYWAVERGSSSADGQNWGGGSAAKPIRCIRSLPANAGGSDVSTVHVASDASYVAHNVPGTYGYVSTKPTVLEFKDRLVDELYRERTDGVLGPHNEDDKANSFYDGVFVAKEEVYRMESTGGWWPTEEKVYIDFPLKQIINYGGNQINPCASYSEDGDGGAVWRVPNLAEFSAMVATGLVKSKDACCTQFSNMNVRFGFVYESYVYCPGDYVQDGNSYKTPTINTVGSFKVRCVRDVPEGYVFPQ